MASPPDLLSFLAPWWAWWWGRAPLPVANGVTRRTLIVAGALQVASVLVALGVVLTKTSEMRVNPATPLPGVGAAGSTEPGSGPMGTRFGVPSAQRRMIFNELVSHEAAARAKAQESFPGEPWSQEDDRAADERDRVRTLAADRNLNVTQVYLILDEGMRERWPANGEPLDPHIVPLQPRRR